MMKYVALLRAVNVGGTGNLPMAELKAMCRDAGFARVETYIASGNVVFESKAAMPLIKSELERRLLAYAGKPIGVVLRTGSEIRAVLKANPFPKGAPNHTYAFFLNERPPSDALEHAVGMKDEKIRLGKREIYVHYVNGMGRSKLKIPAANSGTARNMNTIAKARRDGIAAMMRSCHLVVRCAALLGLAGAGVVAAVAQNTAPVVLMTAGDGSAFLPYGQGLAAFLAAKGIAIVVKKSAGSNENLSAVDASATTIATSFMGSAYDAINGIGWAAGRKHDNLRALFPMYETSFQIAALRTSAIGSLTGLDGKKVGVGPAKGPAEVFFRAAAVAAHIKPIIVNGDPGALAKQLLAGDIDALWQGAAVPIPSLSAVTDHADAVVFGLSDAEVAAMLRTFPQLSATTVPAASYKGQAAAFKSVSAWNFVVANKDLPFDTAYTINKTVLSAVDPKSEIYPSAAGTRSGNAVADRFMPFHPGAMRFYAEAGIKLAAP